MSFFCILELHIQLQTGIIQKQYLASSLPVAPFLPRCEPFQNRELICTIPQQPAKDGAVEHKKFTDLSNLTAGASLQGRKKKKKAKKHGRNLEKEQEKLGNHCMNR